MREQLRMSIIQVDYKLKWEVEYRKVLVQDESGPEALYLAGAAGTIEEAERLFKEISGKRIEHNHHIKLDEPFSTIP